MGSILLFGWNLIIHIMSSLQHAQSFPCIRQLWHSVYCHCRQCLMVSLLFFNLCCEEGLPLLHLVWSSVGIDWPLTSFVWLSERRRGRRTQRPRLARPGCSLVVATETETTCSGKLCFFSQFSGYWQSPYSHIFTYSIHTFLLWVRYTVLHSDIPLHLATAYSTYWKLCIMNISLSVYMAWVFFPQFYTWASLPLY